jgi:hypothetical protein
MSHPVITRQALCCYLCGTEVGHVATVSTDPTRRLLVRSGRPDAPLPRRGGLPRCPHCGGSLYLDEVEEIAVWPTVRFGPEKPGRKPRVPREAA